MMVIKVLQQTADNLYLMNKEIKMDFDDLSRIMGDHDDFEINFAPHYVKILRSLADKIESGEEIGVEGKILMSSDAPGLITYTVITKKLF
jgi:hypothetical protein